MILQSVDQVGTPSYDLIVAGGGAAGLVAAVAAARLGARVLLLERQGCLGGTATTGYVAQYIGFYNGDTKAVWGIPHEILERIVRAGGSNGFGTYTMAEAAANPLTIHHFPFNPEVVKIVLDEIAAESGVEILFHASVVGISKHDSALTGLTVETVAGRRDFSSRVVVDATGDATVAHLAGVPMLKGEPNGELQPNTLCFRLSNVDVPRFRSIPRDVKRQLVLEGLGRGELFWESLSFVSTPGNMDAICLMSRITGKNALDEKDASDQERIGRAQIKSIVNFLQREVPGFENSILASIAPRVGVRETRRIKGHYTLRAEDILEQRVFPDVVALGVGPMDIHDSHGTGITLSMPPEPFQIPMRCLLPLNVDGLIVTGRAISATREANGGARHMGTAMALGQAAGTMAAVSLKHANSTSAVPAPLVQQALIDQGACIDAVECRRLTAEMGQHLRARASTLAVGRS